MGTKPLIKMSSVALCNDPIEIAILMTLENLRYQNKRYRSYVDKSGVWAKSKDVKEWKPYDFFHYFCSLYVDKYKAEYKLRGNLVRACQRMETFTKVNKISNKKYKEFIDKAFSRHFTNAKRPVLGVICSSTLYNKIMKANTKPTSREDWFNVEQQIDQESKQFSEYVDDNDRSFVDKAILQDQKEFEE